MGYKYKHIAEYDATGLYTVLAEHSAEYELLHDEPRKRFVIFREFGQTRDGSCEYRGLIAEFKYETQF